MCMVEPFLTQKSNFVSVDDTLMIQSVPFTGGYLKNMAEIENNII